MQMGAQRQQKNMRRAVRKEQNKVVLRYCRNNWPTVLSATVTFIQTLKFPIRFKLAMKIIFVGRKKKKAAAADIRAA
jgi:hypothetical protein